MIVLFRFSIADFCTYVVENELWEDNMRVWEAVAEIISWSIMCDTQHFEGARPSIGDFREAFTNANADTRKADALLFYVLRRLVGLVLPFFDVIPFLFTLKKKKVGLCNVEHSITPA